MYLVDLKYPQQIQEWQTDSGNEANQNLRGYNRQMMMHKVHFLSYRAEGRGFID